MTAPVDHDSAGAKRRERGRVVVAGGTGGIGRQLVPALAGAGYQVVVLTRSRREDSADARYLQWDPTAIGPWQQALSGCRAVINLCGAGTAAGRWTERRKAELVSSRVQPSETLVAAANALPEPPAAILQASGVHYYGNGDIEVDEQAPNGDGFLARLAAAWEAPLEHTLIRTVALRFGAVLDPDSGALPQMLLPFRLGLGGPVAGGQQWLSWIHITDAVAAILFVLESPLADGVNVTAPQPVTNAAFARAAGRALRRPAVLPTPGALLRLALGEMATLVCDGVRAVPGKLQVAEFDFRFGDIDAALRDLTA